MRAKMNYREAYVMKKTVLALAVVKIYMRALNRN